MIEEASYDSNRPEYSFRNLMADSLMIFYLVTAAEVLEAVYGKGVDKERSRRAA